MLSFRQCCGSTSDPDQTFHFDVDPDPFSDLDLTPSFTHVGKSEKFDSLKKTVV